MNSPLISVAALADQLADANLVVVDSRHDLMNPSLGRELYAKSHIRGAIFMSIDNDLSSEKTGLNGRHPLPSPDAFARTLAAKGISNASKVVVYDQGTSMYAGRLWWMLKWLGHDQAYVLDGGFALWEKAGHAIESTANTKAATAFTAAPRESMRVVAADVLNAISDPSRRIVDARAPERYRGEVEPIDPVAGHIPGASNRPFALNLADGKFKPADTLRAEFDALLAGRAPEAIIHQCGSGVSAISNLLAMEHAGLYGSKLYPGSWSEWCADSSRPVAKS